MEHAPDSQAVETAKPSVALLADSLGPALSVDSPTALAAIPQAAPPANSGDPPARSLDDYDWVPVFRKPRADGWSAETQRKFIEVLADTGSVMQAAMAVGKAKANCYKLRRSPGAEGFAAAWAAAIDAASTRALDEAFERAMVGSDEPVFDRDGNPVGRRFRQSDRLLMFILRAYMPERFRYASRDIRVPGEPPPPPIAPVAQALALLSPARPDGFEDELHPEDLATRLECADLLDGELPPWHRAAAPVRPDPMPMGEQFERDLENAKREPSGLPPLTEPEWQAHRAMLLRRATNRGDLEMPGAY